MRKPMALFVVLLTFGLISAGCVPATAPATPAPTEPVSSPLETEPAATTQPTTAPVETASTSNGSASEVTLVVWDQFYRGAESDVMDTLNAEFEDNHPGVTIERVPKVLEDLNTTVKLALAEEDGPDISQVNQGRGDMGALVTAGLLLPLDEYSAEYGWGDRFSESVNRRNRFTSDGATFGEGDLYGLSPTAEVVGVFYNKAKFAENGWEIPATFDEFEQLLAGIQAAGETPIAFGNLDGWPGIHEFSSVQHVLVDGEYIDSFVYGTGDVSFDIPENRQAAETLQAWVDAGYFTDGFAGIGYDDSAALFENGEGVMMITGSWLSAELEDGADAFGFFLMPQEEADAPQLAVGGVGVPFAIRRTTEQADLAAEYLDWMVGPRAAELWAAAGFVPAMQSPEAAGAPDSSLFADTVTAWNRINEDNGVGHYLDWATPTMYDTITAELQRLYADESTPEEFVEAVQADYESFIAEQ